MCIRDRGTIVPKKKVPPGAVILPSFMVLQVKRQGNGAVERFRARCVAGGNVQTRHSYTHKSAPVVEFSVVRLFFKVCISKRYIIIQVDVIGAFLNGDLDEIIYIRLPKSLPAPFGGALCRLYKSMYGLKQAHHQWHKKLCADLRRNGFVELPSAPCFFRKEMDSGDVYILIYVDNLLVAAAD